MSNNFEPKNLLPIYFTELHSEVLNLLGEEKCLQLSEILGNAHEAFSYRPIACYIRRKRIVKLLNEGNFTHAEIATKMSVSNNTVRTIQQSLRKKNTIKNFSKLT